jgi:TRAP-type transport system periplasmic protein
LGLQFNDVDPQAFRERLKAAGFYKDWYGRFGDEAWALLEAAVGALS